MCKQIAKKGPGRPHTSDGRIACLLCSLGFPLLQNVDVADSGRPQHSPTSPRLFSSKCPQHLPQTSLPLIRFSRQRIWICLDQMYPSFMVCSAVDRVTASLSPVSHQRHGVRRRGCQRKGCELDRSTCVSVAAPAWLFTLSPLLHSPPFILNLQCTLSSTTG